MVSGKVEIIASCHGNYCITERKILKAQFEMSCFLLFYLLIISSREHKVPCGGSVCSLTGGSQN